ncbi:hypothetical protein K2P56_00395 [Patescibacteria group bacterium]|nr:hypothetical protein [Patescibacteria group bacterium]
MTGKDRRVTGFPLIPREIPEHKMPFVETFTQRILAGLSKEIATLDPETQRAEVGNIIYHDLHDEGFDDRLIITVRELIVAELRQPKRGE